MFIWCAVVINKYAWWLFGFNLVVFGPTGWLLLVVYLKFMFNVLGVTLLVR